MNVLRCIFSIKIFFFKIYRILARSQNENLKQQLVLSQAPLKVTGCSSLPRCKAVHAVAIYERFRGSFVLALFSDTFTNWNRVTVYSFPCNSLEWKPCLWCRTGNMRWPDAVNERLREHHPKWVECIKLQQRQDHLLSLQFLDMCQNE